MTHSNWQVFRPVMLGSALVGRLLHQPAYDDSSAGYSLNQQRLRSTAASDARSWHQSCNFPYHRDQPLRSSPGFPLLRPSHYGQPEMGTNPKKQAEHPM